MGLVSQETSFTLDNMGRFLCNTLDEAMKSAAVTVGGKPRGFDTVIIGGGTFGAIMAATLFQNDPTRSRRILVLEAGPFTLPEHAQNLPFQGGTPDFRAPWDSHPALGYPGLLFTVGGRSIAWGGWSPQLLLEEMTDWPQSVVDALRATYFRLASDQLGVTSTNDFIYGRLHTALRRQLLDGLAAVPEAIPLAALPNHPIVLYAGQELAGDLAMAMGATAGAAPAPNVLPVVSDVQLRSWLGLDSTDTTSRPDLLNLLKLEAPLAVQARAEPGMFPSNKFSAVPGLTRASRMASSQADGVDEAADARKRLMIVPKVRVLDIITETQADNWVRATAVRVKDIDGVEKVIQVAPPRADGRQSAVVVALGTIESTRLAQNTFQQSLAGRAAERMGRNLVAHLRSNLAIRVPVAAIANLPPSDLKSLEASALFVKGKAHIADADRFFHLQITASGLNRLGDDSEAELFKKIPDTDQVDAMLRANDTHVVITIRGIGEMTAHNPDSFVRPSPSKTEDNRAIAEVTLADVKSGTSTTAQSEIDKKTWEAMDTLADEVALIFANGKPFEILGAKRAKAVPMPATATVADLQAAHPHGHRRDAEGSTHHDAGTLWMGPDVATSVTDEFGRIHDTTNCYVASPAIFPTLGSPNPMLTGAALGRRTAEMLTASVLPKPALRRAADQGFTALFDGTAATFKSWKTVGPAGQNFAFLDGELVSYGGSDFALLYYTERAFADFHLRLQFRVFDANNANSGVFIRFRDPLAPMPAEILRRAALENAPVTGNPAWSAVFSGFEVQIDDNARGDTTKDFYGRFPEPDGLWKNRTGAIYKIPAGDLIMHLGSHDARLQQFTPGPPVIPGVWMQYDIVAIGNHYEVTLSNIGTNASQVTTIFNNTDADRGVANVNGQPGGYIGIQSYPKSPVAFRDIWIK